MSTDAPPPPNPGPLQGPLLDVLSAASSDQGPSSTGTTEVLEVVDVRSLDVALEALEARRRAARLALVARRRRLIGRAEPGAPVSRRALRRRLRAAGFEVVSVYVLWPSAAAPRVAWAAGDRRARRWAQRSGLLVTGGGRLGWRALARSSVAGRMIDALAPSYVVVARRPGA